jgi:hypothetical protein
VPAEVRQDLHSCVSAMPSRQMMQACHLDCNATIYFDALDERKRTSFHCLIDVRMNVSTS